MLSGMYYYVYSQLECGLMLRTKEEVGVLAMPNLPAPPDETYEGEEQ